MCEQEILDDMDVFSVSGAWRSDALRIVYNCLFGEASVPFCICVQKLPIPGSIEREVPATGCCSQRTALERLTEKLHMVQNAKFGFAAEMKPERRYLWLQILAYFRFTFSLFSVYFQFGAQNSREKPEFD